MAAKSNIERRRMIRAAEHKRDQSLIKIDGAKGELAKARLELSRVRKLR
jgi:hypothetical protein